MAELRFSIVALERGLQVSKPIVDNYPYDFIVINKKTYKVQVKSTVSISEGRYHFKTNRGSSDRSAYTTSEIDFFAFYVFETDIFYIVPSRFVTQKTISIYPAKSDKYDEFYEAWKLFV